MIQSRLDRLQEALPWMRDEQAQRALCIAYWYGTRTLQKDGEELQQYMEDCLERLCEITQEEFEEYFMTGEADLDTDEDEDDDYQQGLMAAMRASGGDEKEFQREWAERFVLSDD